MSKGKDGALKTWNYYGSIAGVVCAGPVDELVALVIDNKMVWPGGLDWADGIDEIRSINVRRVSNVAYVRFENPTKCVTGTPITITGFSNTSLNYQGTVSAGVDAYEFSYPSTGADFALVPNTTGLLTKQVQHTVGSVLRFRGRSYTVLSTHYSDPYNRPPNGTYWSPYSVLRSAQANPNTAYAFSVEGFGNAYLYWGTSAQLLDASGEALLSQNGHPNYRRQCVLVLKDFLFGRERTTAPNVEVIVRKKPNQSLITSTPANLDADSQANPAAVAAEWLSDPVFGLGKTVLDSTTANAIAGELETDHGLTYISTLLDRPQPVRALFTDLAQYYDGWFRWSGSSIQLGRFIHNGSPPTFSASNTLDEHDLTEEPSWDVAAWSETSNSALVKFKDRNRAFKDGGSTAVNSYNRKITGETRSSSLDRPWIKRRQQATDHAAEWIKVHAELYATATVSVRAEKATSILPGDPVRITNSAAGISINCRCIEKVTQAPPSGRVTLKVISERSTGYRATQTAPEILGGDVVPLPESILRYVVVQVPPVLAGDTIYQVSVIAARTHNLTTGFRVWMRQAGDVEFFALGEAHSFAVHGKLHQSYASSVGGSNHHDDTETLQLDLDPQTVLSDLDNISREQTADAINQANLLIWIFSEEVNEICTVKAIRAHAGVYKLKVVRKRFGTQRLSFPTLSSAFIFYRSNLKLLTHEKWSDYGTGDFSMILRLQAMTVLSEADLEDQTVCPNIAVAFGFKQVPGPIVRSHTQSIGNGSSTTIDVAHGLNSLNASVIINETGSNKDRVYPATRVIDANTIRLVFPFAPGVNAYQAKVSV